MGSRLKLQALLEDLIGSKNVYYNPPSSITMSYPAIKYSVSNVKKTTANNSTYSLKKCYTITIINKIPTDDFVDRVLELPLSSFDRPYVSDGLHHYVIQLYY